MKRKENLTNVCNNLFVNGYLGRTCSNNPITNIVLVELTSFFSCVNKLRNLYPITIIVASLSADQELKYFVFK